MKIKKSKIYIIMLFYFIVIYTLMSPFLFGYISPYCKYVFLLIVMIGMLFTLASKRCVNTIGFSELLLITISFIYVLLNAFGFGGFELVYMSLTAYIIYVFPILLLPFVQNKIDWNGLIKFLVFYGVIDSIISITEYITRVRLFPLAGLEGSIDQVTSAGTSIVRTYGLQGSFFIIGDVLCLCGFSSWYLFREKKNPLYLVCWIVISLGIFSTGSRGYYVSYFVGMIAMMLAEGKVNHTNQKFSIKTIVQIIGIIILIVLGWYMVFDSTITFGIPAIDTVLVRIRMIGDWSGDSANLNRIRIWTWAYNYWMDSFFLGHGACCTQLGYSGYISVTESGLLKRLVELGFVGTILVYLPLLFPLVRGLKSIKKYKVDPKVVIFIGVIAAYFVEDCVLQRYTSPAYTIILWFSVAYIAYAKRITN